MKKHEIQTPLLNYLNATRDISLLLKSHIELFEPESKIENGIIMCKKNINSIYLQSAYVLIATSFEAFIESSLKESFLLIINNTNFQKNTSTELKKYICQRLKNDKNEIAAWQLVGDNLSDYLIKELLHAESSPILKLNSPNSKNINNLFNLYLGIEKITDCLYWEGNVAIWDNEFSVDFLDSFIKTRGGIAHGNNSENKVNLITLLVTQKIITQFVYLINNKIVELLATKYNIIDWVEIMPLPVEDWDYIANQVFGN